MGQADCKQGADSFDPGRWPRPRGCICRGCDRRFRSTIPEQDSCGEEGCIAELLRWEATLLAFGEAPKHWSSDQVGLAPWPVCEGPGCFVRYAPRSGNQRYCQGPDCLRAVKREQARVRKARERECPERALRHREEEAARRARRREQRAASFSPGEAKAGPAQEAVVPMALGPVQHEVPAAEPIGLGVSARGHAAPQRIVLDKRGPRICQRPGCFAPVKRPRGVHYCGPGCRRAVQRVLDRKRKWRVRGTTAGRLKRFLLAEAKRAASFDTS